MSTVNPAPDRWHAPRLEHVRVADAMHADLDLVGAAAAGSLEGRTAGDISAGEALAISDDDLLDRAVHLLSEHQVSHLVVVGAATGRPVGVLSTFDVAGLLAWHENG